MSNVKGNPQPFQKLSSIIFNPGTCVVWNGVTKDRVRLQLDALGFVVGNEATRIRAHAQVKLHLTKKHMEDHGSVWARK